MFKYLAALAVVAIGFALALSTDGARAQDREPVYLSPEAIAASPDGSMLYVAGETAGKVLVVKAADGSIASEFDAPTPVSGVAVSPDGARLFVTQGAPQGKLLVMDAASGNVENTIDVGHSPLSPVVAPDGKTVYVCNRFDDQIGVVDIAAGKQTRTIDVLREPHAAGITPDGKSIVVANLLPDGSADESYVAANVSIIDTASGEVTAIRLPNGSMALRGVAVSPDGKNAYISHILARYQLPTTQLDRGWMNTNALTVVDIAGKKLVNTVLLDNIDRGAANPWGVAVTPDGKQVCVTHAGTHEVSVIDREKLHDRLSRAEAGEQVTEVTTSAQDVPNDLAFLVGIRRRLKLAGNGPRGLAVAGGKAWAAEYFTGTLGVVNLDADTPHKPRSVSLGDQPELTEVRKGYRYVNDAAFCFQGWQSCATCHPDMRTDGLNWDLLNDGIGNPRQTKSLLLSHATPPVMITGVRAQAEVAVRAGIRYIQFAVRPEEDAEAIDAYLKQMTPVSSPYLVDGELSEAAQRGEELFEQAGCAGCHPGPLYTDMQKYEVGTGTERDAGLKFDTPSLVECWRTGPYLVRGQAKTIMEVLTKYNENDNHGKTSDLNEQQLKDLAEYVLSL